MTRKTTVHRATARRRQRTGFVLPLTVSRSDFVKFGSDDAVRMTAYTMIQAAGRLHAIREEFGRSLGLTGSQWAVLIGTAALQRSEGSSIAALAEYIHLAPTHVSTEVGRLIRKGMLRKRANKKDRRGVLIRLTPKSEAALVEIAPIVRRINDVLFQNVSIRDFESVTKFLRVFVLNSEYALADLRRLKKGSNSP